MGGGAWSTDHYTTRASYRAATGTPTFAHDAAARLSGRFEPHDSLNPKGLKLRESRDSEEHPESVAIAVVFDVTGSMGSIPQTLQKKLPELLGLLLRKGYVEHPQIMFAAVGDATCDKVPLQIGQFESDNRMDECLENMVLEGGGGGQQTESYELGAYALARHTDIDCFNKRGHKGYVFFIGDEMAYPAVNRDEVQKVMGYRPSEDAKTSDIFRELQRRYHTFYILPKNASYGGDAKILNYWKGLLGENVLELDEEDAICEIIALRIGMLEDAIDLDAGINDLVEFGVDKNTINAVSRALARTGASSSGVPVVGGDLPGVVESDKPNIVRL